MPENARNEQLLDSAPSDVVQAGYGVIQRLLGEQYTRNFSLCQIEVRDFRVHCRGCQAHGSA